MPASLDEDDEDLKHRMGTGSLPRMRGIRIAISSWQSRSSSVDKVRHQEGSPGCSWICNDIRVRDQIGLPLPCQSA